MEVLKEVGMEKRLDQINEVLSNLLTGLNISRTENEKHAFVSPMESFCDSILEYGQDEASFAESGIQQTLIDKFQELLTENDRLQMQVEDFNSHEIRDQEPFIEFLLNKDQIKSLHQDTENLLHQDNPKALLKIRTNSFILESTQKQGKIIYFTEGIESD